MRLFLLLPILVLTIFSSASFASDARLDSTSADLEGAPKLYIDAGRIDMDHVRREVQFVNYVRDRKQCDILLLVTNNRTGSGGREYGRQAQLTAVRKSRVASSVSAAKGICAG